MFVPILDSQAQSVAGDTCAAGRALDVGKSPLMMEKNMFCFAHTPAATGARNVPAVSQRTVKLWEKGYSKCRCFWKKSSTLKRQTMEQVTFTEIIQV